MAAPRRCPSCSKPIPPGAGECPRCARQEAKETFAAQVKDEADELRDWPGKKEPPPPLLGLPLMLVLAAVYAGALVCGVYLWKHQDQIKVPIHVPVMLPGIGVAVITAFVLYKPLKVRNTRLLRMPEDAARYFLEFAKDRNFSQARLALATHPSGVARFNDLYGAWQSANPSGGLTTGTLEGFTIGEVIELDADSCLVGVTLTFKSTTGINVVVASYHQWETRQVSLSKLAVRRNDRWYLVSGAPNDLIDRRIAQILSARAGSPPPSSN